MVDEEMANGEPVKNIAKVTIKGPDIDIARSVDEATMGRVIGLLFGTPSSSGGPGAGDGQVRHQQEAEWDEDMTLGEFISATGASTFQHKICAAGYYLIKIQGADSFTSNDVKTALADAHEDMPTNFSRDFGDAASKNYIAKKHGGEAGHYVVPTTGRKAVESHFTDLPPRRRARKTAKRSSSNGKSE